MSDKLSQLVGYCRKLPFIVEDVKWDNDLVFSIDGGRMFCVFDRVEHGYASVCFKVDDHRFLELTDQPQFIPAPYMARAKWVKLIDVAGLGQETLEKFVHGSYQMYFEKLSKKRQCELLGEKQ